MIPSSDCQKADGLSNKLLIFMIPATSIILESLWLLHIILANIKLMGLLKNLIHKLINLKIEMVKRLVCGNTLEIVQEVK